ncbi:MAG: hydrogenase maturation nickel metallochaperone HypA [Deltaproteobacteria bacterium]|nr:hydrogenase maturation nickel metallochaperone HypA [Deltaproteobacteria bacterium]MBW2586408.1 hydrogenase maturation nickel metallochaperone HypA [Deltaproteobacteria bacterium]
MHEYSIVASLIDRVQKEANAHGGTRVHRLHVQIGELAGVEIDLLKTAFETFRERTICDGAELAIDTVAPAWACASCERTVERGAILRCEACGRPARMTQGDEIILQRIEMEAPNV